MPEAPQPTPDQARHAHDFQHRKEEVLKRLKAMLGQDRQPVQANLHLADAQVIAEAAQTPAAALAADRQPLTVSEEAKAAEILRSNQPPALSSEQALVCFRLPQTQEAFDQYFRKLGFDRQQLVRRTTDGKGRTYDFATEFVPRMFQTVTMLITDNWQGARGTVPNIVLKDGQPIFAKLLEAWGVVHQEKKAAQFDFSVPKIQALMGRPRIEILNELKTFAWPDSLVSQKSNIRYAAQTIQDNIAMVLANAPRLKQFSGPEREQQLQTDLRNVPSVLIPGTLIMVRDRLAEVIKAAIPDGWSSPPSV